MIERVEPGEGPEGRFVAYLKTAFVCVLFILMY